MAEIFDQLESNKPQLVEEAKQVIHAQFNQIKDSWLLNGLYEFYLCTNSVQSMEIMINIREPHHTHLFDKLSESIRGNRTNTKVQALTLLGHIVRKHPTWLHKITQHQLFRELLRLLRLENGLLPLLSALLVLIVLLPCIPALMKPHLPEVFEIFSRLASWNSNNPGKLGEELMVHMQVGLYALFQRLYGMYPCNFLTYLRENYKHKELSTIFKHTIQPMLQTVQMHPRLVTNSKDSETATDRWKCLEPHDVIMECESFSLDLKDRFSQDTSCFALTSFRSRSGTNSSSTTLESPYPLLKLTATPSLPYEGDLLNISQLILHSQTPPVTEATAPVPLVQSVGTALSGLPSQEGTSPPEAAIEATPETTPIKDARPLSGRQHPQHTTVARALNSFGGGRSWSTGSAGNTPTHSQPSSPMRKDTTPVAFHFPPDTHHLHASAFGAHKRASYANQRLHRLMQDRSQVSDEVTKQPRVLAPTSPLRIIPNNSSPVPPTVHRGDSPVSEEDEEVLAIVNQGDLARHPGLRQCDSVLHDNEMCRDHEDKECGGRGSPCTSGGLHMPNSKQFGEFRDKMKRLRYHSQCGPDGEQFDVSTGSSPRNSTDLTTATVRRAKSCPEMKKDAARADEEEAMEEDDAEKHINGWQKRETVAAETQTENFWPMPYEHLFLSIFPSLEGADIKPSPAPSPAPYHLPLIDRQPATFNDIIDRYVQIACQVNERTPPVKEQMQLLQQQLLFERHRRETHAIRNRTLFTDVTKNKVLQEHNSALSDQVKLQENKIDELQLENEKLKKDKNRREKDALENSHYFETKCKDFEEKCRVLKEKNEDLHNALSLEKTKVMELDTRWQCVEAAMLDASAEVENAREQVLAGEKGRAELVQINRELLLAGEIIQKYQERLSDLNLQRRSDQELVRLIETHQHEVTNLRDRLELKQTALESCRTRIAELEHKLIQHDESSSTLKRLLKEAGDECHEKIRAMESRHQTMLSVNRALEGKILELYQQIEVTFRRAVHSPDTSSCHEVNVTMTSTAAGLSPHSSPLSASLASSEGSVAFVHPGSDMKNLQMIADEKEGASTSSGVFLMRSSSTIESELCQEAPQQQQQQQGKND